MYGQRYKRGRFYEYMQNDTPLYIGTRVFGQIYSSAPVYIGTRAPLKIHILNTVALICHLFVGAPQDTGTLAISSSCFYSLV